MDGYLYPFTLRRQAAVHQCPIREMVLLLYKVFCGRGIHVGAESMGHSLCCALSSSAVYRAGISRQQLSKWLCDLCGCNPKRKSCVTWKVLAQSAAVITLLLLQHEACNQCLTTSVRTTSRARDRIHRLQHEPTFQGFGANSIDFRHDNRVAAVVPGLCASNTAHHGNNQLRKTCNLLAGWSGLFGNGQCSHWTQGAGHFRAAREARTAEARGQSKQSDHKIVLHPLSEYNVRSMALIATASAHRITKFFIRICNAAPHRPNCGGAAF